MKNTKQYYITNQNDMYLYSEIIHQAEPHSVIDIGMFLKRIGALTRNIKDRSIPYDMILDGVDFAPEITAKIYEKVYDTIEPYPLFRDTLPETVKESDRLYDNQYDLAFILGTEDFLEKNERTELLKWGCSHAKYLVISGTLDSWNVKKDDFAKRNLNVKELHVETDEYRLIMN